MISIALPVARRAWWLLPLVGVGCTRPEPPSFDASRRTPPVATASIASAAAGTACCAIAVSANPDTPATENADSLAVAKRSVGRAAPVASTAIGEPSRNEVTAAKTKPMACQLLAVGDSLTDPKSGGGGYLEIAHRRCGCQITNLGRGGAMVNQIRARLLGHLAETKVAYSHVVVFGGVNDLYSDLTAGRSNSRIETDLEAMYRAASRGGAKVIAVTVTPWGGFQRYFTEHRWQNTRELNRWIRESSNRDLTAAVVDGEQLLSCGDPKRLCEKYASPYRDGLHFGPLGHRRLGRALVHALGYSPCQSQPDDGSDDR